MCATGCVYARVCRDGLSDESATAAHCKLFNKATADRIMGKQLYAHIVHNRRQKTEDRRHKAAGKKRKGAAAYNPQLRAAIWKSLLE